MTRSHQSPGPAVAIAAAVVLLGYGAAAARGTQAPATAPTRPPEPTTKPARPVIVGDMSPVEILAIGKAWSSGEASYEPAPGPVAVVAGSDAPVEIEVVFGSWCGDSEEQVPHYLKILARAEEARQGLGRGALPITSRFHAVRRKADGETEFTYGHGVDRVPTFIVSAHGEELGRVVETPQGLLEEDLAAILAAAK